MAISDSQFRLGVGIGAVVLVGVIAAVRFTGSVSLPPKPNAPSGPTGSTSELLVKSSVSAGVYLELLGKDAIVAGVRTPTIEEMSRKFPYRVDDARHVLEVGQPAIEIAGLKLRAIHSDDALVLEIKNTTAIDLAYNVVSQPAPNSNACASARPLPLDVLVIGSDVSLRTECVWRDKIALVITKVETIELPPLAVYLIDQVPPALVSIPPLVARGHRGLKDRCGSNMSQVVRSGIDKGEIGWRDLVDFYSRHRCQTYQFPAGYRAFTSDGQQPIPVTGPGN